MEDARGLLLAAKRAKINVPRNNETDGYGNFTFLASDGWGKELKLVESVEELALGAITVELQSETIKEFDNYFKRLVPPQMKLSSKLHKPVTSNHIINTRNPW